jgi:hypothetical protein
MEEKKVGFSGSSSCQLNIFSMQRDLQSVERPRCHVWRVELFTPDPADALRIPFTRFP